MKMGTTVAVPDVSSLAAQNNYFTPSWPVTLARAAATLSGQWQTIFEVLHRDGPQTADRFKAPPFSFRKPESRISEMRGWGFDIRSDKITAKDAWGCSAETTIYSLHPSAPIDFKLADDPWLQALNRFGKKFAQLMNQMPRVLPGLSSSASLAEIRERLTEAQSVGTDRVIAEHRGLPPGVTIH